MRYVLDTSFLIDLERRDPDARRMAERLAEEAATLLVPTPVLAEYLVGAQDPAAEALRIGHWAEVEPFDHDHALRAARVLAEGYATGHAVPFADALIRGYAETRHARIVTADSRGFPAAQVAPYRTTEPEP